MQLAAVLLSTARELDTMHSVWSFGGSIMYDGLIVLALVDLVNLLPVGGTDRTEFGVVGRRRLVLDSAYVFIPTVGTNNGSVYAFNNGLIRSHLVDYSTHRMVAKGK